MSHKIEVSTDIINTATLRFWVDKDEWDAATETARRAMVYDAFKAAPFVLRDDYKAEGAPVIVHEQEGATLPHAFEILVYDPKA